MSNESPARTSSVGTASVAIGAVLLVGGILFTAALPALVRGDDYELVRAISLLLQVASGIGGLAAIGLGVAAVRQGGRAAVLGGVGIGLGAGALAGVVAGLLQIVVGQLVF